MFINNVKVYLYDVSSLFLLEVIMGTPCYIFKKYGKDKDGFDRYKGIYCHYDGYLDGAGKILLENYSGDKVDELINLGDIRFLDKNIENIETYYHEIYDPKRRINNTFLRPSPRNSYIGTKYIDYVYLYEDDNWYRLGSENRYLLSEELN